MYVLIGIVTDVSEQTKKVSDDPVKHEPNGRDKVDFRLYPQDRDEMNSTDYFSAYVDTGLFKRGQIFRIEFQRIDTEAPS